MYFLESPQKTQSTLKRGYFLSIKSRVPHQWSHFPGFFSTVIHAPNTLRNELCRQWSSSAAAELLAQFQYHLDMIFFLPLMAYKLNFVLF